MRVAVVGALTIDITHGKTCIIGGPPWYAGTAVHALRADAVLYSAVGGDFPDDFMLKLAEAGLDTSNVIKVEDASSYVFEPVFKDGVRVLRLVSQGPPLPQNILENVDTEAVIVSPVFKEVGKEHVMQLRSRTEVLSVDLQGFLRQRDSNDYIFLRGLTLTEIFRVADVIHCSAEEAVALTGRENVLDAASALAKLGAKNCLVGFTDGLLLTDSRSLSLIEVVEPVITDEGTGAGDILTGAFTTLSAAGTPPEEAGVKALEVVARSLKNPPPDRVPKDLELTGKLCRVVWRKSLA
ncbi:MAG: PfkB family carbohydrate kinase [Candidatus Caldarchaeum sp.]